MYQLRTTVGCARVLFHRGPNKGVAVRLWLFFFLLSFIALRMLTYCFSRRPRLPVPPTHTQLQLQAAYAIAAKFIDTCTLFIRV